MVINSQRYSCIMGDRGAEFNSTDHRLVISKMKLKIRVDKVKKIAKPDVSQLSDENVKIKYQEELANRYEILKDELGDKDLEREWNEFKTT